jgi:cytochrome c biogenesis protein CcdA
MIDFVPDFVPNAQRLTGIFQTAAAPTFFLGAVAGFASLMTSRMSAAMDRVRTLNAIKEDDLDRAHLRNDLDRLLRRAELLKAGIFSALVAGVFATLLLGVLFITEFLGLKYAYGAAILFIVATFFLGRALVKFAREVNISLEEPDKY